jgi:hypothetical protein
MIGANSCHPAHFFPTCSVQRKTTKAPTPPGRQDRACPCPRNLAGIVRAGLLTSKTQGKLPVVRLCSPSRSTWAILHTIKRHGGRVESTAVLEVDVPWAWLGRSRKGLWFCPQDIPPDRIRRALCFAELAGASTEA